MRTDKADVVDLRSSSPLVKFSAIRQGKILFEKTSGPFDTFKSLIFRIYVDTKKLRDAQEKAIQNFLGERGLI